jgi:hypothetical protein
VCLPGYKKIIESNKSDQSERIHPGRHPKISAINKFFTESGLDFLAMSPGRNIALMISYYDHNLPAIFPDRDVAYYEAQHT